MKHYVLDGKLAKLCPNLYEWGQWFETANRAVAKTKIGDILVSTVFLGLDHNFSDEGDPLLFETLVFDSEGEGGEMLRYFTWDEAEAGHKEMVKRIEAQAAISVEAANALIHRMKTVGPDVGSW